MGSDRFRVFLSSIAGLSEPERQAAIDEEISAVKEVIAEKERQRDEVDEQIKNKEAWLKEWF